MNLYRVTDVRPALRLASLRDSLGRNHVVRINAEVPGVDCELNGPLLRLGHSSLLADRSGQVFDLTADAVECDEEYVFERLHVRPLSELARARRG